MEALLASPSSYSSPESGSSFGGSSPRLPDLESPLRFAGQQFDIFTPSSASTTTRDIPAWLSEDLEEEWVEREASNSFEASSLSQQTRSNNNNTAKSSVYAGGTTRQPSGLRRVMSNSSIHNTEPSEAGSLVVKSLESNQQRSPMPPSQLEVAARAIKGERGGLGSPGPRSVSQKLKLLKLFEPPSPSKGRFPTNSRPFQNR